MLFLLGASDFASKNQNEMADVYGSLTIKIDDSLIFKVKVIGTQAKTIQVVENLLECRHDSCYFENILLLKDSSTLIEESFKGDFDSVFRKIDDTQEWIDNTVKPLFSKEGLNETKELPYR